MFLCPLQNYKKHLKLAIPKNGDAAVYQLLSIASFFKTSIFKAVPFTSEINSLKSYT